jgi:hypothetical protein
VNEEMQNEELDEEIKNMLTEFSGNDDKIFQGIIRMIICMIENGTSKEDIIMYLNALIS